MSIEIDKKIFDQFFNENKHLLSYKPKEYGIDEKNFIEWINNYTTPELKSLASLFRKYTRYVSYSEYVNKIASICADIRSKSIEYDTIILLVNNLMDKSNFWVALLHYSFLQDIITNIVVNNLENYTPKNKDEKILGIICDDASYSGVQFILNMGSIPKYMDILISIPYMSTKAKKRITFNEKNIYITKQTEEFKTFGQYIQNDFIGTKKAIDVANEYKITTNLHTIFFNHKLADMVSIYQLVYIFGTSFLPSSSPYFNYKNLSLIKGCSLEHHKENWDIAKEKRKVDVDVQKLVGIDDMCPFPFYKSFVYTYKTNQITNIENLYSNTVNIYDIGLM